MNRLSLLLATSATARTPCGLRLARTLQFSL